MRLMIFAAAVLWVGANGLQSDRPQFRTGIDVVRVEATVLDERRRPIRGLTMEDFVVRVNGTQQKIVALSAVEAPEADTLSAAWTREAAHDVASNALREPRIFVIIMDDAVVPFDLYMRNKGRAIANGVIDNLGPQDLAAIVFTQNNNNAQDLTADRAALHRAASTYNPLPLDPRLGNIMSLGVLRRTREFLARMPDHRRAIIYITTGPGAAPEDLVATIGLTSNEAEMALDSAVHDVAAGSRLAHVPIYSFSPAGLLAQDPRDMSRIQSGKKPRWVSTAAILRTLSNNSGGHATVDTNAPERGVPTMFGELKSYYALAYEPTYAMDGRMRRLQIQVKRKGATVLPDGVSFETARIPDASRPAGSSRKGPSSLVAAVSSPVAVGSLSLRLTAAPFVPLITTTTKREAAVALILGIDFDSPPGESEQVELDLRVFDGEGRRQIIERRQSARVVPRAEDTRSAFEIALRVDLPPGRYQLRLGASVTGGAKAGSVFTSVTVPDFWRKALTMSGVAIGRANARPVGGRESLADLLSFEPTVERQFAATDNVGTLVRLHQPAKTTARAVTITTQITDSDGRAVSAQSTILAATQFNDGTGVDHRYELPLRTLKPGDYLLTFSASTSAASEESRREVRFAVRR